MSVVGAVGLFYHLCASLIPNEDIYVSPRDKTRVEVCLFFFVPFHEQAHMKDGTNTCRSKSLVIPKLDITLFCVCG
jgi:hypothetical protein